MIRANPVLLKGKGAAGGPGASDQTESGATIGEGDAAVRCAACEHELARCVDMVEVAGQHRHVRMNPAGFVFTIACYRRAEGVIAIGAASDEFAWFPHASWRVALCGACRGHVGWTFEGAAQSFVGLRLDAIVES